MGDLLSLVEECQGMAVRNPSLSFTGHPYARFFPCARLYDRAFPPPPSHPPVVLSHHLSPADRRTDGRLSRARSAPFLFFTSERREGHRSIRACLSPRPSRNKTAATTRIDASRCKFVLFFMAGHPAALASQLACYKPANKGFLLQRRRPDRPSSTCVREKSHTSARASRNFIPPRKCWYAFISSRFILARKCSDARENFTALWETRLKFLSPSLS